MKRERSKKKVYQYDMRGYFITEHRCAYDAADHVGIAYNAIIAAINGVRKTAKGFQWSHDKCDKINPVQYKEKLMLGVNKMQEKRFLSVEYTDFGIIENPLSSYFGKRKILIGKMEVYAQPEKDINELIEKYSKAI